MLRTNYQKKDWDRLLASSAVTVLICVIPLLIIIQFAILPATFLLMDSLSYSVDNDLLVPWAANMTGNDPQKVINLLTTVAFGWPVCAFLGIFGFLYISNMFGDIANWTCRKLRICPIMDLVVLRDGRYWFSFKVATGGTK